MDIRNTECIISTGVSEGKRQYNRWCINKKKRCYRKTRIEKNLSASHELEKSKRTIISFIHENHRSQEAEWWQIAIQKEADNWEKEQKEHHHEKMTWWSSSEIFRD